MKILVSWYAKFSARYVYIHYGLISLSLLVLLGSGYLLVEYENLFCFLGLTIPLIILCFIAKASDYRSKYLSK